MQIRDRKAIRERWIQTVDPATPSSRRVELERAFRKDVKQAEEEAILTDFDRIRRSIERIPDRPLVAVVMSSGYDDGLAVFAELRRVGKAPDIVRLGYSAHSYSGWKYFSDGSVMSSHHLYITSGDMDKIIAARESPLLLVDDVEDTGLTLARTGAAIRARLEHIGELWAWVGLLGPSMPFDRQPSARRNPKLLWVPEIATELGAEEITQ